MVNDGTGLGFGIFGGKSTGVVVKTILPGGVADNVSIYRSLITFVVTAKKKERKHSPPPTYSLHLFQSEFF